jgi:hypothetical protein
MMAAGEAALGAVALAWPRTAPAAAVCASYVVFAAYVVAVRRRHGPLATCGCFGTPDTPATSLHVVVNVALAVAAGITAAAPPGRSIMGDLAAQPWHGAPLLLACAVACWLVVLTLSSLAKLQAVRALLSGPGDAARPGERP